MYRTLVADVGGTNSRFGLIIGEKNDIQMVKWYDTTKFDNFYDMLSLYVEFTGNITLDRAIIAVAGVVRDDKVSLTNINLSVEASVLRDRFNFISVELLNDFEAAAWGILALKEEDIIKISGNDPKPHGVKAVLGAGTGLGEAIIVPVNDSYKILVSEGGHCDLSSFSEQEFSLAMSIYSEFGHASMEHILSGGGILRVFRYLCEKKKLSYKNELKPSDITGYALMENDDVFEDTMRHFCHIYGREAGNLALKTMALGGIYIAGGIINKIYPKITKWGFLDGFLKKGRMRPIMEEIPLFVVKREDLGLLGCGVFSVYN